MSTTSKFHQSRFCNRRSEQTPVHSRARVYLTLGVEGEVGGVATRGSRVRDVVSADGSRNVTFLVWVVDLEGVDSYTWGVGLVCKC